MARQNTDVKGAAPNGSRGRPVPRVFADSERAGPLWSLGLRTVPRLDRETSCTLDSGPIMSTVLLAAGPGREHVAHIGSRRIVLRFR
jgi:hypothetical protein